MFGDFEEVINTCEEGFKLYPDDVYLHRQIANAYFFLDQKQEAINAIDLIEKLDVEYFASINSCYLIRMVISIRTNAVE